MITAVQTFMGDDCPHCAVPLTKLGDATPWCGACEWNLDHFPDNRAYTWFWRRVSRVDRREGFRSDRELAASTEALPIGGRTYHLLVGVSAMLLLAAVVLVAAGVWLIVGDPWLWPVVLGLVLICLGLALRPRLGRLKPLLKHGYLVERKHAPTLHRMIDRLATDLGAPRPDLVVFDLSWNAATARIGVRQTRVLILGVPLLLALTPQQMVALVGHELGHLKYEDSRRRLLLQPAATTFGRLASLVKPPRYAALLRRRINPFAPALLTWKLVGGTVFLFLWTMHAAVNVVISAQDRPIELRADRMAAQAAGTTAALEMFDVMAAISHLSGYVQRHVDKGQAAASWRRFMRGVYEREADLRPARRQLSIRTDASLFAAHPSPGRRYQWLSSQPEVPVGLLVEEAAGASIERELAPYAEFLRSEMVDRALI